MRYLFLLVFPFLLSASPSYFLALEYYYDKDRSNDKKSIELLKQNKEIPEAAFLVAVAYDQGQMVQKDKKIALEFYEKSATLGDKEAVMITGWRYYKGIGCKKNIMKAKGFFKKAFENGDKEAGELLDIINSDSIF